VGYEIMLEENTQCIASALRNSIINLDMIPKIVYQDNGRAFRAKYFTDDKGFTELGFNGLYSKLGIETVFARPYNARAKVIERFFKEFQEEFEKLLPSYVGSNIDNKPAYLMRNEKLHKTLHNDYIPTLDETIKMIDMWLNFKNSQPCPNAPDKTIAEVLESRKRQNVDINLLDDLMLATEVKTIQRNGIRFLNCDYFDERLYGFKSKVLIKYNLFDLTSIKYIVQCKRYNGHPATPQELRALWGVMNDFDADIAVMVATSGITDMGRAFVANKPNYEVLTLDDIIELSHNINLDNITSQSPKQSQNFSTSQSNNSILLVFIILLIIIFVILMVMYSFGYIK